MKQAVSLRSSAAAASPGGSGCCSPSASASRQDSSGLPSAPASGQGLDADHQTHAWCPGRRRQQLLGQAVVRHHHRGGAAVLEQIGVLAGGVGGVGRHGDAAGGHDRQIGDQPLRPVLRDQQHPIAGRQPLGAQRAGKDSRLPDDPLPRPGPIDPVALAPEKRLLTATLGHPLEQRHQVGTEIRGRHAISRRSPAPAGLALPGLERADPTRSGCTVPTDSDIRLDWPVAVHICPGVRNAGACG